MHISIFLRLNHAIFINTIQTYVVRTLNLPLNDEMVENAVSHWLAITGCARYPCLYGCDPLGATNASKHFLIG